MWTENVAWFSNEAGKKGQVRVGQLADLIVPDRDYFACPESGIADTTADLTIVGGKIVWGAGDFRHLDDAAPRHARLVPIRRYGGYAAPGEAEGASSPALQRNMASCGCTTNCGIHGHDHARAWSSNIPAADLRSFWRALGRACWAVCATSWRSAFPARPATLLDAMRARLHHVGARLRSTVASSTRRCSFGSRSVLKSRQRAQSIFESLNRRMDDAKRRESLQ